jgi:quercetin dioxygenase-like cupin family protein
MRDKVVFKHLDEQVAQTTTHGVGQKTVLLTNDQCVSNVTQVAQGILLDGDIVEVHTHPTMEEFYYFCEGKAILTIAETEYTCVSGNFVKIPANTPHSISVIKKICFIYWGVSI